MKRLLVILSSVMLLTLLVGCKDSSEATDGNGEGTTELTLWSFVDLHLEFYKDAADRWNKENPDRQINLKTESFPVEQMHNNLSLALQSGSGAPDIVDIEVGRFANFLKGEPQLEPMNEYVEPIKDQFITERLDLYSKDGNYYGMPTHLGATVMYYNTEIMDQAGIDIDSINTWEEYVEAGKQVVEKTGVPMTTFDTTREWSFWTLISQRGSDFFDEKGNVILDSEKNIETLQFMSDLINKYEIAQPAPGGQQNSEEFFGFFNGGGSASVMMPMWYMGRFIDYMPDLKGKIQIRPLPAWHDSDNRSTGMGGTGTVVTNQAEPKELAKEFLAFAKLTEEANIQLWKTLGFDPPRWDVWDSPELQEDNKYFDYFHDDIFNILLEVREDIKSIRITPYTPDVILELNTNVSQSVLRDKSKTPEEALKQASDNIKQLMKSRE